MQPGTGVMHPLGTGVMHPLGTGVMQPCGTGVMQPLGIICPHIPIITGLGVHWPDINIGVAWPDIMLAGTIITGTQVTFPELGICGICMEQAILV